MDLRALASDMRLTLRLCRRGWISTCTAILLLGVGVSVAALGRAVAQGGWHQGVAAPDRIGVVGFAYQGRDVGFVPRSILAALHAQARSFAQVVAIQLTQTPIDAAEGEGPRMTLARVTDGFFELTGVSPVVGRRFVGDEYAGGGAPVLVLSHALWRKHFHGAASAIGATLALAGTRYTVVGVMPAGFVFPQAQAWTPVSLGAAEAGDRGSGDTRGYVRLRSGVTWDAARAEMALLATRLAAAYPEAFWAGVCPECGPEQTRALRLQSRREQIRMRRGQTFLLFQAPTLLLLATTLVTVAGLAGVKALSRRVELATRLALGATRRQLVRHFLLEGMVLAIPAAVCSLALLRLGLWYLSWIAPPAMQWLPGAVPYPSQMSIVVGGCAVAALGIAMALAIGCRLEIRSGLTPSGMTSVAGFRTVTLRDLLVVLQVAMAGLTLSVAALLAGAQASFASPYFGFKTNALLAVRLALAAHPCTRDCGSHLVNLAKSTSERLRQFPGVVEVTAADTLPQPLPGIGGEGSLAYVSAAGVEVRTRCLFVDQDFFGTLGVGVVGPDIGVVEVSPRRHTLIVSDALAKSLWKRENPVGRAVSVRLLPGGSADEFVVVGVAPDLNYLSIDSRSRRMAYLPLSALPADAGELRILIRVASDPQRVLTALRAAFSTVDGERALRLPETYEMARARGSYRDMVDEMAFVMGLMLAVSLIAVAIAVAGVGGVTLASVVANQKALAIRATLGASPAALVAHVLGGALLKVLAGVMLVLPTMAVPLLRHQESIDPAWGPLFWNLTWWSVMLCGGTVVVVGCYLPARIAARTDLATLTRQT